MPSFNAQRELGRRRKGRAKAAAGACRDQARRQEGEAWQSCLNHRHGTVQRILRATRGPPRQHTPPVPRSVDPRRAVRAALYRLGFRAGAAEAFSRRMLRLFKTGDILRGACCRRLREIGVKVEGEQHGVVACDGRMKARRRRRRSACGKRQRHGTGRSETAQR